MPWHRPLTGVERWHWLLDRAAPTNLVFIARLDGRVDQARLCDAVGAVVEHFPHVAARIVREKLPAFVSTESRVPVRVEPWRPGAWTEAAVDEANARIPTESGPLLRLVLLDGADTSDLLFTFSQVAADGHAGLFMAYEALQIYGGGARPALPSPSVFDPPIDDLLGSRLHAIRAMLARTRMMRSVTPMLPERHAAAEQRRTGLVAETLPAATIDRIAFHAAAHGTSVHGAIGAAVLMAIAAEMRGDDEDRHVRLGCTTPMDLRRHTPLSPETAGVLLSRTTSAHRIHADSLFWDIASQVSAATREFASSGGIYTYPRMKELQTIGVSDADAAKRVARSERFNRTAAIVHNLGRLEIYTRYGDLALQRLSFLSSCNAHVGTALTVNAVTVGACTTLNFGHADPLVSPARARRLASAATEILRSAAS